MSIMPFAASDDQISFKGFNPIPTGIKVGSLEWKVINQDVTTKALISESGSFSNVVFSFTLKRQPTYHVLTVILPVIVLYIVGLMVFALPADSGEKVSLCVACLMSYFLTQLMISQQIPRSWNSVPVVSKYLLLFVA